MSDERDPQGVGLSGEDETLVLTGRLEESSFADLMKSLGKSRETAVVTLSHEAITKSVYVQNGRIVFASSSDADDPGTFFKSTKGLVVLALIVGASAYTFHRRSDKRDEVLSPVRE